MSSSASVSGATTPGQASGKQLTIDSERNQANNSITLSAEQQKNFEKVLYLITLIDQNESLAKVATSCRNPNELGIFPESLRKELLSSIRTFCIYHLTSYKEKDLDVMVNNFKAHNRYSNAIEKYEDTDFDSDDEADNAAVELLDELFEKTKKTLTQGYRELGSVDATYPRVKKTVVPGPGSGAAAAAAAAGLGPNETEMSMAPPTRSTTRKHEKKEKKDKKGR